MFAMKHLMLTGATGLFFAAAAVLAYDLYVEHRYRRATANGITDFDEPEPVRWRTTLALVVLAWMPMLIGLTIVLAGSAGVHTGH